MTAARSSTPPEPTIIAPVRCTATSQPCRWSPAMIGATAYSPTPPGSWWWPGTSRMPSAGERSASASTSAGVTTVLVGAHAGEPPRRRELGQGVVGGGVEQPQPVADLGDVVPGAGAGDDLAVGPQAQHRGAVEHHGQPLGDLRPARRR